MAVISCGRARNLMLRNDWKLRIFTDGETISRIELYHPNYPTVYNMRQDSANMLMPECRVCQPAINGKTILCYDHAGSNEALV